MILVVFHAFGDSSFETVKPVLTAAVRSEPLDGQ
jgi:hypothetical protein